MFLLVIAVFIIIGFLEIVPLIKENEKRQIILYLFLYLCAFLITFLLSIGIEIPTPAKPLNDLYESFMHVFSS